MAATASPHARDRVGTLQHGHRRDRERSPLDTFSADLHSSLTMQVSRRNGLMRRQLSQSSMVLPATPDLLGLPAEVRNQICEYVLTLDQPLERRHCPGVSVQHTHRALLQTCRQTRTETLQVYLGNNTFVLSSVWDLGDWLDTLGHHSTYISRVILKLGVLEGSLYDVVAAETPTVHPIPIEFLLTRGRVLLGAVGGQIQDDTVLNDVLEALKPAATYLGGLDPEHQLSIAASLAHCKHCAMGMCKTCGRRRQCCKQSA